MGGKCWHIVLYKSTVSAAEPAYGRSTSLHMCSATGSHSHVSMDWSTILYEKCNQPWDALTCHINVNSNKASVNPYLAAKVKIIYIYIYIYTVIPNRLFRCIPNLQCGLTCLMLQAGIETRQTLRQSDILLQSYRTSQRKWRNFTYIFIYTYAYGHRSIYVCVCVCVCEFINNTSWIGCETRSIF